MNLIYNKFTKLCPRLPDRLKAHKKGLQVWGLALLNAFLLYYCLELGNKNFLFNGPFYTLVNIITVFTIQSAIYLIFQYWWLAASITAVPVTLLSIANYYTLMFRNQPISTQDIHNAGTALSVLGSYKLLPNIYVIAILVCFALSIWVIKKLFSLEKGKKIIFKNMAIKNICLLLFCVIFVRCVYLGENPVKPRNTFVWSWEDSYYTYGYAASSIEVFQNSLNMVNKPEDYSEEALSALAEQASVSDTYQTPDIILILNETFYDLRDLVDIETDEEFMPFIDNLENAIKGRCVIAGTGGGTNKSEYELLTSNSMQLMPGITPFNYLDFNDANSIVSHLKSFGYSTWGAHCAEALNYSRGIVYPRLGFDTVKFREDFKNNEGYASRYYATDESNYKELISDYEAMGDGPRFMYLLTIQNHGGWELNDSKHDLIHTLSDFGEYTDDVDEFLTCIKMSDNAFKALTEYFKGVDRPVIICMAGDHAPSFAQELTDKRDTETVFNLRSTPYVMWANFDIDTSLSGNISMPVLVPRLLETAGIPLSPFYGYVAELSKDIPVITANNLYKDKDGHTYNYTDRTPYSEKINIYFNMVYNNTSPDANRIDSLFCASQK